MKLSTAALFAFASLVPPGASADEECTHGKLYVVDDTSSDIHVFDVSSIANLDSLEEETTIEMPAAGAGALVYYGTPADPLIVQYRGEAPAFEGFVRVVDTGFYTEDHEDHVHVSYNAPTIVENANIDDCRRPIHQVRHDGKVAIFCDGAYDVEPQQNTTIYVVDESKLGSANESAIVQSTKLQGAHHGVAIPVDDGHLLHSIATDDRINRVPNVTSLPSTFQVIDPTGQVLHDLADTNDPAMSCAGFHGSASVENTFALGCGSDHGAVVIVQYDPTTESYTSRAVSYPDEPEFEGFRVGSFAYHKESDYFIGSFSGGNQYSLAAIAPTASSIDPSNIFQLGDVRQCAYQFEAGAGGHLLVFMPDGVLHVLTVDNGTFTKVGQQTIVPDMMSCSDAAFVAGIGQVFIATPATKTMYSVDLTSGVDDSGCLAVHESTLPFTPTGMTVSGFSPEYACAATNFENLDCPDSGAVTISKLAGGIVALVGVFFAF